MKLRHLLPCIALFSISVAHAQDEPIITAEPVVIPEASSDPNEPFTMVEEMPSFPGGEQAMFKHFATHVKYPDEASESGIHGAVYVTFIVERDGRISDVKVLRGIGGGCDEEAVRVVNGMPNWIPGKQNGKIVRVRYNLPIRYAL